MEHSYQQDFSKLIQGQSIQTSDDEIMTEVRKVMMADKVEHPEVVRPVSNRFRFGLKNYFSNRSDQGSLA